jgi:Fe-S-cluster containining protein
VGKKHHKSTKARGFDCLSEWLALTWDRISTHEREHLGAMHAHYEAEFKRIRNSPNQPGIAAGIHDIVDRDIGDTMRSQQGANVTCRKGCSHCCHMHVGITRPEAALLLAYAEDQGVTIDWDRVRRQSKFSDPNEWVERQPFEDTACVFLGADGTCQVYEHRPTACRKHLALSDPALCDLKNGLGGKAMYLVTYPAEVAFSASFNVFERGSMPVMLLKERGRHERTSPGVATASAAASQSSD